MSDSSNGPTIELDRALPGPSDRVSSLVVGQILRGRYVLQERLGTGGSGAVFKALDRFRTTLPSTHQFVALKVLHAEGDCSEAALANLRLEFHCGQVLSHPNIVNVYELDRDGDLVFFTMELLEGEPLSRVIERLRPATMRQSQAWQLIRQLGAGLAHAHEHGVVHGDLKPENIFVTHRGELRILDFGAAHRFMTVKSGPEHVDHALTFGTPAYASCEQLEGRPADPRDDLYALACICYEILAGCHPFESRPATLARDYRANLVRPKGLGGRQWRALQKGLAWHRAGRSISVRLWMRRLIRETLEEQTVTPLQEVTRSPQVKSTIAMRAAALFLIVALTGVAVLARLTTSSSMGSTTTNQIAAAATPNEQTESSPSELPAVVPQASGSAGNDLVAVTSPAKAVTATRTKAGTATPMTISIDPSPVRSDDHFAEIRLHSNLLRKNSSFTWWTEPATAKPGVDYVPESVAIQTFPAGYHSTRLYVRLLPDSSRLQRAYFYVAIADPDVRRGQPTVIRRQIWLPTSSSLHAQR